MTVEAATFLNSLNPSLPPGTDQVAEGDNHIRLLKQVLKNTFPNLTAAFPGTNSYTFTALQTFSTAADSFAPPAGTVIELISTSDSIYAGPSMSIYRNSPGPVIGDGLGNIYWYGKNTVGVKALYAQDYVLVVDPISPVTGIRYWGVANGVDVQTELGLSNLALYPAQTGTAGLDLGTTIRPWGDAFLTRMYAPNGGTFGDLTTDLVKIMGVTVSAFSADLFDNADAAAWRTSLGVSNGSGVASFSVHKNAVVQNVAGLVTPVKVTWPNEQFDTGNFFAANTWTPPLGRVFLHACVATTGVTSVTILHIYKNGVVKKSFASIGDMTAVTLIDSCTGTDTYDVYFESPADGTYVIDGTVAYTYFVGTMV